MQTVEQTLTALRPKEKADLEAAIAQFKKDISTGEKLLDVVPQTQEQFEYGSTVAKRLQKANTEIDRIRLKANKPHQDSIKHNNFLIMRITDSVGKMVRTIRANNDRFLAEQQRIQREEEEKARRIEEGRIKAQQTREAKGMNVKPVEDLAPVTRPVDFKQTTSVQIRKVWKFRITNYAKVPEEYKKPNWQMDSLDGNKIRATKGEVEISGIEVYSEDHSY